MSRRDRAHACSPAIARVHRNMTTPLRRSIVGVVIAIASTASAEPSATIEPRRVHPGDAMLVSVTNVVEPPRGKAGGRPLVFFRARDGYQAVVAVPLQVNEDHILVELAGGPKPISVPLLHKQFGESKLVVEEELADPSNEDRVVIGDDNRAIGEAYAKSGGAPQFARAFRRPPGATTSPFGEWRTFNDRHRAQHLGLDLAAHEGAKVATINAGTVSLVRDTFLSGTVVVIAHGGGISSLYFHLSKASVREGDVVRQGDEIGRAGHTGRTTGPHVHLSIHVPGGMVDPDGFFKLEITPSMQTAMR
jgi:murein DD-endopeptidase MepM/ murein hydrolase activator NlpD